MKHTKEGAATVISLGSSLGGRKGVLWRKVEREILEVEPNYSSLYTFSRSKKDSKEFFLMSLKGKHIGRAAAVVNERPSARWEEKTGFIDDFVISPNHKHLAGVLIGRCLAVLKRRKVEEVIVRFQGFPAMVAQEFDQLPPSGLPCNPSWYAELFERNGFRKHKEWANFRFELPSRISEADVSRWKALLAGTRMRARPVNARSRTELRQYSDLIYEVLVDHYGYSPSRFMQSYSFLKHLVVALLFPVVKFRIYVLQKDEGDIVGFWSYHPDYQLAARPITRFIKRVWFPFNVLVFVPAVAAYMFSIRRTKRVNIGAVGLAERWRRKGFIRAVDYGLQVLIKEGYKELDTGPVLVENAVLIKLAENFAKRYGVEMERTKYYTMRYKF